MDTQTSTAELVQEINEQLPSAFSWDTLKSDPAVRLSVLKKARETAGAEKLLPALYDQLRLLATRTPQQQEEMKEGLVDMLSAFGMELAVPVPILSDVESPAISSPAPSSTVSVEITPPADTQNQGFARPRPTPEFSAPVLVPETIPEVVVPAADAKQQFVTDMKAQLSEAHDTVVSTPLVPEVPQRMPGTDPYREPTEPIHEPIPPVAETVPASDTVLPEPPEGMPPAEQPEEQDAALMSPEVTKGLEQLLSEWDLFKSSGIFGLGAGGVEHPLYKKLAALPVMSVLSGRWEGADTKAVATIKEYMDGWKGQWSISADPEESFGTYLRRVIARILNVTQEQVSEHVAA